MAEQVVLKHMREALGQVPLQELEIELRLCRQVDGEAFRRLERALASSEAWSRTTDTRTTDVTVKDVRVTDGATAVRKRRLAVTEAGAFRVCTCQEERVPVPAPADGGQAVFTRVKARRERHFQGWKLALTAVNPDSEHPGYEVEAELDNLWLVRRPQEVLAQTGARLMTDVVRLLSGPPQA